MDNLSIRRGASLPLHLVVDDTTALTVTLTAKKEASDLVPALEKQASFVDGEADLVLTATDTLIPVDEYLYQVTVDFPGGVVEKYPDSDDCEGECGFPTLTICESLDAPEVVS